MGIITTYTGPDEQVRKALKEIQEDRIRDKKRNRIYLIIGIVSSGLFGSMVTLLLSKFF